MIPEAPQLDEGHLLVFLVQVLLLLGLARGLGELCSRYGQPRLIGEIPRDEQRQRQLLNIGIVPLLFICLGTIVRIYRTRRREVFKL